MCRYFGKFSRHFSKISNFLEFGFSDELKLELNNKILRTTVLNNFTTILQKNETNELYFLDSC